MTDKPRYKIICTPALVTIRFRDGTELKMSPQYAGKLAIDIDLAAISAEKKGRKKCKVASKWNYVPPRQLTPRPDMDEANDKLAAARSDEIRKGWDQRMQEAEALQEEPLASRNALDIVRKRIQAISGLSIKCDLTTVEIDLKKAETDGIENAIAADCPLTSE